MGVCQTACLFEKKEGESRFYNEIKQMKGDVNYKPIIMNEKFSYFAKSSFNERIYEQKTKYITRVVPMLSNVQESSIWKNRSRNDAKKSSKEIQEICSLDTDAGICM